MAKVTRLSLDSSGGLEHKRLHLREISDDADAPLDTVGLDLRKARQRKGEDLAQISRVLKIRKDHLDALEESNFDALPGRAYAIGFVRTYAEYLGLDQAVCVERLKTEIAGRSEAREGAVQMSSPRERWLPPGVLIFALLLLVAVIYGAYSLFVAVNRMATDPVTPVPARLAEQAGLATPPPAAPATGTPDASVPDAPLAAVPAEPAQIANAGPPASVAAQPLPAGRKYGEQNTTSRITILVHRATRVVIQGRSNLLLLDRQLQPGDTYLVPNMVGLTLTSPDASALELILDGTPMGYAGKEGVTSESVSLNPQDVVDRRGR